MTTGTPYAAPIEYRAAALTSARATGAGRARPHRSKLAAPDSSSIAGRRASGFLQVSLSKVTRHPPSGYASSLVAPSHLR